MNVKYPYNGAGFKNRRREDDLQTYSPQFLTGLLRSMLRIRIVEEQIASEYHKDEIKNPVHLVIGQEAVSVGLCAAMKKTDLLYLTHRTHGGYLAKGGDLKAMMSELYCKANGCAGSRGGSMHLFDKEAGVAGSSAIVGGIIPIATGGALAFQMRGEKHATAVLFGDAANEEGVTSESLNFAVLKKLPIVYFCENNFYSVQSPLDYRQPITRMTDRAAGFGIKTDDCDGSNVLDVFEASQRALKRAHAGEGPTFIEAPVYRWLAHAGASDDSPTGYRAVAEREHWQKTACPIALYTEYLKSLGVIDPAGLNAMEAELKKESNEAFEHAKSSPPPTEDDLRRHAYAMG
jgi:pyruvate dehydrogenase E1 component alpha subunit